MRNRAGADLTAIDSSALLGAISEFNELGRTRFLKRYGVSRSSRFYLIHNQRLYDTKALVASAYRHATGRKLRSIDFAGGAQTKAVFDRLAKLNSDRAQARFFEDSLGELRNLSTEYDRIPRSSSDFRQLGFSKWIRVAQYRELKTGWLPGVYAIASAAAQPIEMGIVDDRVIYIGETVDQNIGKRLNQFNRSIEGKGGHSGGDTLRGNGYRSTEGLWLCIRSFPLGYGLEDEFAASFRSAQIRHLERMLLYEYVSARRAYPCGNSK